MKRKALLIVAALLAVLLMGTLAVNAESSGTIDTSTPGKIVLTNYKSDQPLMLNESETTIVLNGNNSITIPNSSGGQPAIHSSGSIKFTGSGTLTVNSMVYSDKDIISENTTLNIDAGTASMPSLYARKISITGSSITAKGNFILSFGNMFSLGDGTSVEITNGSNVTVTGSQVGLAADSVIVDKSVLNVTPILKNISSSGTEAIDSSGIYAGSFTARNGARVTVKGTATGINTATKISVDHSYVSAEVTGEVRSNPDRISAISVILRDTEASNPKPEELITITNACLASPSGAEIKSFDQESAGTLFAIAEPGANSKPAWKVVINPDHSWDSGKVTKAPTTSSEGVQLYTCTACGKTKSEKIARLSSPDHLKPGSDASMAEAAILALPDDKDPVGTAFGPLQLKASKTTKNSIKLTWKNTKGATKYIIYANACGKNNRYKKLATVTGTSTTIKKVAGAKLKKGKYYKFIMVAVSANDKVVSTSKTVHAATDSKFKNPKKVKTKAKKNKVVIKTNKTFKLSGKQVGKKVKKHRGVRYETSDATVATVSTKGAIKGVRKGACFVYAYAQNGVCAKIKVIVK